MWHDGRMSETAHAPIDVCMDRWYDHLRGRLEGGFDALLHPDVVFFSPIVFTPQEGIELTKMYLMAAGGTLGGDTDAPGAGTNADGGFGYTKEIRQGNQVMLEFETSVEGKYVNGVDIITCDDDGMIIEFKVMIRPLQAIDLVHQQMKAMLERMGG